MAADELDSIRTAGRGPHPRSPSRLDHGRLGPVPSTIARSASPSSAPHSKQLRLRFRGPPFLRWVSKGLGPRTRRRVEPAGGHGSRLPGVWSCVRDGWRRRAVPPLGCGQPSGGAAARRPRVLPPPAAARDSLEFRAGALHSNVGLHLEGRAAGLPRRPRTDAVRRAAPA